MAACDACISLAGLVVDLVIIMAVLTVSRACNLHRCLIGVMYLRPGAHLVLTPRTCHIHVSLVIQLLSLSTSCMILDCGWKMGWEGWVRNNFFISVHLRRKAPRWC